MRSDDIMVPVIVGLFIAMVLSALLVGGYWLASFLCDARWSASGMKSSYGVFSGCMVEVSPGKVIPERSYRGVE